MVIFQSCYVGDKLWMITFFKFFVWVIWFYLLEFTYICIWFSGFSRDVALKVLLHYFLKHLWQICESNLCCLQRMMPSQATSLAREDRGTSIERHHESEQSQLSPRAQGKRKFDRDEAQTREGRFPIDIKLDSQVIVDDEANKTNKSGISGRVDKKQKGSVFSRISFPEHRDTDDVHIAPGKKRIVGCHGSLNGFREHESTVRLLNGSKVHYDDAKPVKKIANGRRSMYDDDLHLSDNEHNFKRKSSSHRREISSD